MEQPRITGSWITPSGWLIPLMVLVGCAADPRKSSNEGAAPDPMEAGGFFDAFVPEISDCEALRQWVAEHPDVFVANNSIAGVELSLRSLDALTTVCDERDWTPRFTDSGFGAMVAQRRNSDLYVLEARFTEAIPGQQAHALIDSLRKADITERWSGTCNGRPIACVFAVEEAIGGIAPGMNLLLGFDGGEGTGAGTIHFNCPLDGVGDLGFTFDHEGLRALNRRLADQVKYTVDAKGNS